MGYVEMLTGILAEYLGSFDFLLLLCVVIAGIFLATQAYAIFIKLQTLEGALLFGYLGYIIADFCIGENVIVEGVDLAGAIGIVCAGIGALIFVKILKFSLFLCGGLVGFMSGNLICGALALWLPSADFFHTDAGMYVISGVAALILGFLFMLLFKPLYIIGTSFSGGICAGLSAAIIVLGINDMAINIGLVAGLVIGLICCIVQFKRAADEGV